MPILVLTGASGSGKTAIADAVELALPDVAVFRFDTIGVPAPAVIESFGSGHQPGGAWQRAMTLQWFDRLTPVVRSGIPVLFEGQMRPAFIEEARLTYGLSDVRVILIDCSDQVRTNRLAGSRLQPDLATASMMHWAHYLRVEALERGYEVLDTSEMSLADVVRQIIRCLTDLEKKQGQVAD